MGTLNSEHGVIHKAVLLWLSRVGAIVGIGREGRAIDGTVGCHKPDLDSCSKWGQITDWASLFTYSDKTASNRDIALIVNRYL